MRSNKLMKGNKLNVAKWVLLFMAQGTFNCGNAQMAKVLAKTTRRTGTWPGQSFRNPQWKIKTPCLSFSFSWYVKGTWSASCCAPSSTCTERAINLPAIKFNNCLRRTTELTQRTLLLSQLSYQSSPKQQLFRTIARERNYAKGRVYCTETQQIVGYLSSGNKSQ